MRLLRTEDDGSFSLVEFWGNEIPPYAILSHIWYEDDQEVTFTDCLSRAGKNKEGYVKLVFCSMQAAEDHLKYFWVDTCCIDKSSSIELHEAINYQFKWYRNASKCYVYLSDVRADIISEFRASRWFTRGWTLQELLAPQSVEFFSAYGERIGDRNSLLEEIHATTGIPVGALQGRPLFQFSVEERLSWAKKHVTRREEDAAYCLLGIFDVNMPVVYGEGKERAFRRLQEKIAKAKAKEPSWPYARDEPDQETPLSSPNMHPSTNGLRTGLWGISKTDSEDGYDLSSMYRDRRASRRKYFKQEIWILRVSRALLSEENLKVLYVTAVQNIKKRKARTHIRGFLKEYGRNLLNEAGQSPHRIQAAKLVQELAGHIADKIIWVLAIYDEVRIAEKGSESWLSSTQTKNKTMPVVDSDDELEDVDSDDELDNGLHLPNLWPNLDFLLHARAMKTLVKAMQSWLKVGNGRNRASKIEKSGDSREITSPNQLILSRPKTLKISPKNSDGNMPFDTNVQGKTKGTRADEVKVRPDSRQIESAGESLVAGNPDSPSQQDAPQEVEARPISPQNHRNVGNLVSGLLDYQSFSFFFYNLVDIFFPRIAKGHKRFRWRCSCNTVLWGDFPAHEEDALNQLKQELAWWAIPSIRQWLLHRTLSSRAGSGSGSGGSSTINLGPKNPTASSTGPSSLQPTNLSIQLPQIVSNTTAYSTPHTVNIPSTFFEVCVNVGNYAVDHHEIDISDVKSDSELFGRIWDKYSSSRGIGLRRLFLRPRNVHFVMFFISRRTKYGAGIHKQPDEYPPQLELDEKRYHYLCPKLSMPANVFLHYLSRARDDKLDEHNENTWLKRLPKKLNESILAAVQQNTATNQQYDLADPDLAFGWGVHILHGPNHAVLALLLCIGVAIAFVISGMVVGFAKTQEQGFGIGSFLVTILANLMAALYFRFQDQ